ncbi:MAG: hypothetical protein CL527_09080 [Aequorivita sp.]|nr:hypothetical protein [Aequorivita sp.]MAO48838.1 hypothetical protein [Aequorivita sp.]MBF32153.1 hypothetical protein [Aequorivita sp.]|tara:strand:- start:171464 stop:172951 length:1488 start_codon:yes stop_codon:yes gene_type:complete
MKKSYTPSSLIGGIVLFVLLFSASAIQAQVGIGTTNPNASSALDITSTTQGLLLPRMTTAQRNMLRATAANSLMVYDTDLKSFYYFDATALPAPGTWVKINAAANQRNNYVLVKSVADLPPPISGTITLLSNTYYEINGTITLTGSINLNNAYVGGLDANEDVLSFPGGTVFKGNTGGSIRNITIKGNKAFEIAGPGMTSTSSLLVQNTIVDGMTTGVGSISGLGLYFGNIVQFLGNTNGITYSNINNLLLNNQAWDNTNSGIYEKFTGNFDLIEKVSGFSKVQSGATGLDVSATSPLLNVTTGVLLGTVFSGAGTYVKPYPVANTYPGYNFSTAWTVNSPGIPRESDDVATGDINLSAAVGSGVETTFSGDKVPIKISGTTTSNNLFRFEKDGNNKIIYRGSKKRYFQVNASVSFQSDGEPTIILYIAKNGSIITDTKVYGRGASGFFVSNSGILALPIVGTVELKNGDSIEIWAERFSGSGKMNTVSLNLTAR